MLPNKLNSNLGFFVYKSAVYNLKLKQNKVKLNKQNKFFFFFFLRWLFTTYNVMSRNVTAKNLIYENFCY
jgi:hypothetical protein